MKSKTRRQFVTDVTKFAGFTLLGGAVTASAAPPLRVRREIRDLATNYPDEFANLCQAITNMKSKPVGSSNAWQLNTQCHASVCGTMGKEIHKTLNFYPWHRGFLYATELNLQAAMPASTPPIALPYWNWGTGATGGFFPIPAEYNQPALSPPTPRVDKNRQPITQLPIAYADTSQMSKAHCFRGHLDYADTTSGFNPDPLGFGGYDNLYPFDSAIEATPHDIIHTSAGPVMADIANSPNDPLFFGHHGNLDRLWEVWRSDPAQAATEPWTDPTFTQPMSGYTYYQYGSSTPLTIPFSNLRDINLLGYAYAADRNAPATVNLAKIATRPTELTFSSADFDSPVASATATLRSSHPNPTPPAHTASSQTSILTLGSINLPPGQGATALIFLSDEAAGPFKLSNSVYAGAFGAVAVHHQSVFNYALDVTEPLERLRPKGAVRVALLPYKSAPYNQKLVIKSFVISTF